MSTENEILAAFHPQAIRRGGLVYFKPPMMEAVVRMCNGRDVAVVGLEGLYIDGIYILPLKEATLSVRKEPQPDWGAFVRRCNDDALSFIREHSRHPASVWYGMIASEKTWNESVGIGRQVV